MCVSLKLYSNNGEQLTDKKKQNKITKNIYKIGLNDIQFQCTQYNKSCTLQYNFELY